MDVQSDALPRSKTAQSHSEDPTLEQKTRSLAVRVLKSPLFLVIFTWVLMAFLLAFEVSGK